MTKGAKIDSDKMTANHYIVIGANRWHFSKQKECGNDFHGFTRYKRAQAGFISVADAEDLGLEIKKQRAKPEPPKCPECGRPLESHQGVQP